MRVIVCGGGTGGHAFPAMAVIEELRRRDPEIDVHYVGKHGSIEERLATARGIPFHVVQSGGLVRQDLATMIQSVFNLAVGSLQSFFLMLQQRPAVVFATGGYTSVPPVLAAAALRIPIVMHEQNSVPGRANRLLARMATVFATAMPQSRALLPAHNVRVVGNPIRSALLPEEVDARDVREARLSFDLAPDVKTILVFGGSQGAAAITQAALDALPHLDAGRVQMLLIAGPGHAEQPMRVASEAAVHCEVLPFVDDMAAAYAAADVVVCRGGAITLAEVAAAGKPAIVVPLPTAADDHQRLNAEELAEAGACTVLSQQDLTGETLAHAIAAIVSDDARAAAMRDAARRVAKPHAAAELAEQVFVVAEGRA